MEKNIFLSCMHNVFLTRRKVDEKIAKEYGLAPIDVGILSFLLMHPTYATASAIEHERKYKKNTLSVHVEALVQLGLLKRQEQKDDRRKVVLALTEKAGKITEAWVRENEALTKTLLAGVTDKEFETMCRCFGIINENALRVLDL